MCDVTPFTLTHRTRPVFSCLRYGCAFSLVFAGKVSDFAREHVPLVYDLRREVFQDSSERIL